METTNWDATTMNDLSQHIPPDASAPVETLCTGKWLSLRKRGRWEYAERNNPGGAVIILAVTPADKVLFVEQYRVSILCNTIEMPAGLVGDLPDQAEAGPAGDGEVQEIGRASCRERG